MERKIQPKSAERGCFRKDGHSRVRLSALFIALMFENYERCFFNEILILIKRKKIINVCCFQVIKNQTNHDYLFQRHRQ